MEEINVAKPTLSQEGGPHGTCLLGSRSYFISFLIFGSNGSTIKAQEGSDLRGARFSSLEEAESVVGFSLQALDVSQSNMSFQGAFVDTSAPLIPGGTDVTVVESIWSDPDGDWVWLFQGPGTGRIANATQQAINGREFEVAVSGTTPTRPFGIAAIGWEEQGSRYMISLPFVGEGSAALDRAAKFASTIR